MIRAGDFIELSTDFDDCLSAGAHLVVDHPNGLAVRCVYGYHHIRDLARELIRLDDWRIPEDQSIGGG
jgi:hypothetical protein